MKLAVELPADALEQIAERAAEIVLERLGDAGGIESPYLTVDEAADFLRCKKQRVYELRSSGRLTAFNDGGRALVARAEVERLVEVEQPLERRRRAA